MSCAFYDSTYKDWYWFEDGRLFGPYATQEETNIERHCVIGSDKYTKLQKGIVKPRVGDFVKAKLDGFNCGHVTHLDVQPLKHHPKFKGIVYSNANGEEQFVDYENVVWLAPYEWSEL